jgi:hypothetical protein
MKKSSKILSIIMALLMVVSTIPMSNITASAYTYSGTCGENVTWEFDESTGTLIISGTGAMDDYEPNNPPWAGYEDSIKTVVISYGVMTISKYAFFHHRLTSITIPDSVTIIGDSAFDNCQFLTCVSIPDSVTTIGDDVFDNCHRLTSFTVDSNNQYFSNDEYGVLFNKDRTTLIQYPIGNMRTSYTIPDSVTTIGDDAFNVCSNLTNVTIPDSVTTIGELAFFGCDSLTSVTIPNSVTIIDGEAFEKCTSLTSVKIGDRVTTIGDYAFYACISLTSITIPNSVKTIDEGAFYVCDRLADVYYDGTEEQWRKIFIGSENEDLLNANIHFKNHTFGDWSTVTSPTCTENGFEKRICTECGKEETKTIFALGHKYNSVVTAPTCTEKGYSTYTCHCGYSYVGNYVNAKGHTYTEIVTNPTCTKDGYTTYTCECGDSYVDDYVDALGHVDNDDDGCCDMDNEVLDPTIDCKCNCHKSGITKFFFNFVLFFQKLFGSNKECVCGITHY